MAKIHWTIYILVGLLVSIMSWRLNKQKLIFFFYAGWVFVFVGVIKLVFNWVKSRASKKETQASVHHHTPHKTHHQTQNIKYCHQCRAALSLHARFCPRCGARV